MPETEPRPAGYAALIQRLDLEVVSNWHQSGVSQSNRRRVDTTDGIVNEVYPASYWPGETIGDHLEFALKYDGTNLGLLAAIFDAADASDITSFIQSKPTGKYARRIWYLYELLTGSTLPIDDLSRGNYVDLLEPEAYYTTEPGRRARRQYINDNLLGDARFCPLVRRTETLRSFESADLSDRCRQIVAAYPPDILKRALGYLYTKETKSSFEIEHDKPSSSRTERFIALLHRAEAHDFCSKPRLIEVQNRIVDPRFKADGYRDSQNYIGEAISWQQERVHCIFPRPEDISQLMAGLIDAHERMQAGQLSVAVHAAAIAYAFVFLHPFEDGNGRIHRFLIHNILARRGFTPDGVMFPVSAAMLNHHQEYDASLEAFSKPIMELADYTLDDQGRMTVNNELARWYRYIDLTPQAEALFTFIEDTIETELVDELVFLVNYDKAKRAIQDIVDMPDRRVDLFIRLCLQNNGRLSAAKRASQFDMLTNDEIERMQTAVQASYDTIMHDRANGWESA